MLELIAYLQHHQIAYLITIIALSLCVGSFLNVVIYRYPLMLFAGWRQECHDFLDGKKSQSTQEGDTFNLMWPRSHCPECKNAIAFWNNIPLFSYIILRGRCNQCQTSISGRYPVIEFITAALSLIIAWHFGATEKALAVLLLTWTLISIAMIDIDHQLIPDQLSLPLLWLGLLVNIHGMFVPLSDAVLGAVIGYVSLWSFMNLFKLITGKVGMGHGDFKLFAVFGAWLGWQQLPFIIICSSIVGALLGSIVLLSKKQNRDTPIPFGPYLAISGWAALLFGEALLHKYLELVGLA